MAVENPISASDITFNTILNSINSDPELIDKPNWYKRIWAGIGDTLIINLNARSNNSLLRTSYTRRAVQDLLKLIDYDLGAQTTSSGITLFYVKTSVGTAIFPFNVIVQDLASTSVGSNSSSSKRFEARQGETFSLVQFTFTDNYPTNNILDVVSDVVYTGHKVRVETTGTLPGGLAIDTDYYTIRVSATEIKLATNLENANAGNGVSITSAGTGVQKLNFFSKAITQYQQTSVEDVVIGTSDGKTAFQEFIIPDQFFLIGTETITINAILWTRVDTFVNSGPLDTVYKIVPSSQNQFVIEFGNNQYGAIPGNFQILGSYGYGGGSDSNISNIDRITSYAGNNSNIVGVSNPVIYTGGSDEQSIDNAKKIGPILLKARDRAVTTSDFEALAFSTGGLSLVKANKNVYGTLSVQIVAIALGGGNPSLQKRTDTQEFLINRTLLEEPDVRFDVCTITSTNVTASAKMLTGYSFVNVQPYFDLAFQLLLSETGTQIKSEYNSNGIQSTIDLINLLFGTNFDRNNQSDTVQIANLVQNLTPVFFGATFNTSDVLGYIDSFVIGIDYLTISVFGTGLPITLLDNEITTDGVITTSEIV